MSSFFDFGVFNYVPRDKDKIMYLKFVEGPATLSGPITPSFSSPFGEVNAEVKELNLTTAVREIETVTENIKVTGDPMSDVANYVIDKAFDRVVTIAAANGKLVNDRFPTGINLKIDGGNVYRKIFSRILAVSNMIAVMGRRGPGNFVLVSESTYKRIFFPEGEPTNKFYQPDPNMAGLKFFISLSETAWWWAAEVRWRRTGYSLNVILQM